MPKKKETEILTRPFFLDTPKGTVEVTVKGPAGAMRIASTETAVFIVTGDATLPAVSGIASPIGAIAAAAAPSSNRALDPAGEQRFRELQKSERERVEAEKKKQKNPNAQLWDEILGEEGAGKSIINHLENHGSPDA
jgi:hypothetical protein